MGRARTANSTSGVMRPASGTRALPISSAMWLKDSENDVWRLYVSTPDVAKHGPTTVYKYVSDVMRKKKISSLAINDVSVANTANPAVQSVLGHVKIKAGEILENIQNYRNSDVRLDSPF